MRAFLLLFVFSVAACTPDASPQDQNMERNEPTLSAPTFVPAASPIAAANVASMSYLGRLDPPEPTSTVFAYDFSPDGARLVALNNDLVLAWNLLSGELLFQTARNDLIGVYTSPDKTEIYGWRNDGEVVVLGGTRGELLTTFTGTPNFASVTAYDPVNGWLALGATDGSFKVWDAAARESRATIEAHTGQIDALAFSSDGTRIASAGAEGVVRVWDWSTREMVAEYKLDDPELRITALAFPPDDDTLAIGTTRDTRLWSLTDTTQVSSLDSGAVTKGLLKFSPDGRYLLAGNANTGLSLWDINAAQLAARLDEARGTALSAAFSASGDLLLTSTFDGETALWNLSGLTGDTINKAVLDVGTDQITDIAWSADGVTLLLFDAVGAVYVWGVV